MADLPKIINGVPEKSSGQYNLEFLQEKGYFEEQTPDDPQLDNGTTVKYAFDSGNRIAYFEDVDVEYISEIVKGLRKQKNLDYYWFWDSEDERVEVLRTFGENKRFIFNPEVHKRDTKRSKGSKLSKIDNEISKLFDVKDVVNRFYKDLWNHRLKLAKSIEIEGHELSDQNRILAAQRLIDRLMFTYFLAEKGIVLGIAPNGNVGEVNAKELFNNLVEESDDFGDLLETIFYDRFNSKNKNDYDVGDSNFSIYLPYLNGGMFRPEDIETVEGEQISEKEIQINGFDWKDLIEELNQYNWILEDFQVETNTSESVKGELTPEILGYIYEKFVITVSELEEGEVELEEMEVKSNSKLQAGNREIGAYYTPEDVVNYIVNENLWSFVQENVEEAENFESFNKFYEEHQEDEEILAKVEETLSEITIVDPGVGSGHFLLSTATQLEDWRKKCGHEGKEYDLRKEMVLENLYGVDIMEGATDICQLRLWLYLVSAQNNAEDLEEVENLRQLEDESDVEPLPNINYNIRTGNSLIGFASKEEKVVNNTQILPTKGIDERIKEYGDRVGEIKEEHENVDELKKEISDLHEKLEHELNSKYANYLEAYAQSEGDKRKLHFEDGEDLKEKTDGYAKPLFIKIKSKKEISPELNNVFPSDYSKTAKGEILPDNFEVLAQEIDNFGPDNLKEAYIQISFKTEDLSKEERNPLHWILEFPEIFNGENEGFDIVIGNPPYGSDVLSDNDKEFLQHYETKGCGDICGYFLEREIALTTTNGFIGNIIADSLAANSSMTPVRDLMRNSGPFSLSFYGTRPSKIFNGVEERVCIINGRKSLEERPIYTAKNIRFTQKMRQNLFENLSFESTEGFLLGTKEGGIGERNPGEKTRLPKIGNKRHRSVLSSLKGFERRIEDTITSEGPSIDLKISGGYWLHALNNFPYDSSKIEEVNFQDETKKNLALVILNSSLFYVHWTTYGNNRDFPKDIMKKFLIPSEEKLEENSSRIKELSESVCEDLHSVFDPNKGRKGEFDNKLIKDRINELDDLLQKLYELEDEEIEYIKNYDSHIRPNKAANKE